MLYFATWKKVLIALVCLGGVLYASPNFLFDETQHDMPGWLPGKQINLGLDLQGGAHLLMEVETDVVVEERLEGLVESARLVMRQARVRYTDLGISDGAVRFVLGEPDKADDIRSELRKTDPQLNIEVDDGGRFTVTLTEQAIEEARRNAVQQSIEIVRRRIDETGTREPNIQRQGENRILVQLPGIDNPERIKEIIGKTAKLSFHMLDETMSAEEAERRGRAPAGSEIVPGDETTESNVPQNYLVEKRVRVSGENLTDAQPTFQDNQPVVSFRFDTLGARKFGQTTRDNVGKRLAIILDGKVISAPRVNEPILGGSGIISGQFTVQGAQDLALLLRAGALPAPLTILEERTVGPGLGHDSIQAGKAASIVGLVLVVVFMVLVYGKFGLMADIALFFNITLIVALLSLLQATLTLPGIAGIVLTVGMAVDANVLIFERIREELRAGRTPFSAVEAGYKRALTTIIDSNLTTFIAAVLLFAFGSGPIKGFAVTLSIGLLTSMFTAIMVTRLFVVMWLRRTRPQTLEV